MHKQTNMLSDGAAFITEFLGTTVLVDWNHTRRIDWHSLAKNLVIYLLNYKNNEENMTSYCDVNGKQYVNRKLDYILTYLNE